MAHHRYRHPPDMLQLFAGAVLLAAPLGAAVSAADSNGEERWFSCPAPPEYFTALPPEGDGKPGQTTLSADEVVSRSGGSSRFRGNVVIQRDGRTLQGDEARYDQQSGEVAIRGNMRFHADNMVMLGDSARVQMEQQSGEFLGVSFFLPAQHGFGRADQLSLSDAEHSRLKQVRYTTCPPDREDWQLSAKELLLDQQSNTGEAYHTTFRFKGVPLFYSPYLNFPLAGRKTGLLPPTIGTSASNGTDVSLPFYWNIAPNYDATFTPRNLTERGAMLMSEFRLLTENSEGKIQADALPNDKKYGDDRNYVALDHRAHFGNGWHSTVMWRRASDALYLNELGADESSNSATHLERRLDLNYRDANWKFLARAQSYQTLTGSEPYQRLPQLKLSGTTTPRPNQLQLTLDSEAVVFKHESQIPTGTRIDLKPAVTLPLQGAAWYLRPSAAWRYTGYRLNDYSQGERLHRSLPILSVDSGLFFDRETEIAGRAMTQTLEPRLFYLSVPYRDQDLLPRFDTGNTELSYSQLFSDNRFNGADRQGDARQLTTALTSRLLNDADGSELLRASIGRILYFEDREVGLDPADLTETNAHSDLFAELELQPARHLRLGLNARYDTERSRSEQLGGRLRYQPDSRRLLNLDYRYDEIEQVKQTDTILYWPMAREWQLVGRWRYDLQHTENLELLGGLQYESCCWAVRLIGRNHRDTYNGTAERSFYLTFEFKGLGSLGRGLEDVLGEELLTN